MKMSIPQAKGNSLATDLRAKFHCGRPRDTAQLERVS
jgi:hypothetical protein